MGIEVILVSWETSASYSLPISSDSTRGLRGGVSSKGFTKPKVVVPVTLGSSSHQTK